MVLKVQNNFYCPTEGEVLAWWPTSEDRKKKGKKSEMRETGQGNLQHTTRSAGPHRGWQHQESPGSGGWEDCKGGRSVIFKVVLLLLCEFAQVLKLSIIMQLS